MRGCGQLISLGSLFVIQVNLEKAVEGKGNWKVSAKRPPGGNHQKSNQKRSSVLFLSSLAFCFIIMSLFPHNTRMTTSPALASLLASRLETHKGNWSRSESSLKTRSEDN